MALPERSVERWFELKTCSPTIDCPLGTLSPEPIDEDFQQRLLQLTDGDITFIYCDLDPENFKNPIPPNQEDCSAWTEKQWQKAASCEKPTLLKNFLIGRVSNGDLEWVSDYL
jgi:hypothetical protein